MFREDLAVRELFVQGIYAEGVHKNIQLDPIESAVRGELRQWYGFEKEAFTAVGIGYSEID